ncbi:MAG: OmpA family protein [Chitinivibrionales bacterium]|nr:OmpA family protein [Chitinivibrionales bacterium]MBD3355690.1 OmpA family protein [Chitinivibrionales bacterium]
MSATRKATLLGGALAAYLTVLGGCASQYGGGTIVLGASGLTSGIYLGAGPQFTLVTTALGVGVGAAADVAVCSYMSAKADKLRTCVPVDEEAAAEVVSPPEEERVAKEDNPFDIPIIEEEAEAIEESDESNEGDEDDGMERLAGDLGGIGGENVEAVGVKKVGEGVWITFDSQVLFGFDSDALRADLHEVLREVAETLNRYPETGILVVGHTDAVGPSEYNMKLSEKRAAAVADFLRKEGVMDERLNTLGRGEEQPVASNDTREGRKANRRVEIAVYGNEQLKQAAMTGMINGSLTPGLKQE